MTDTHKPTPGIYPTLLYRDAKAAIKQLTKAFGFTRAALYESEDGTVLHAELAYGSGRVMIGSKGRVGVFAEAMKESGPVGVYVVVEDTDAHFRRAEKAGVEILMPPTDQEYGSRDYMARDVEGNVWCFGTYVPAG
ncbi:glyoxalase [Streptosporangium nondiastaticum]|uniref:Glyoxalase n=2 Tax=Actinomycetes TaxID=1760 RepID=A0A9X7JHY9_9ACTN|nr:MULTISPECIES: VOC family protein [Actinomycetes]PSJ24028.1 glyoxalase [Streptosporangium nondiastaticum]WKU44274.1 VOC family protein [Streptomyces sp. VNUA116]